MSLALATEPSSLVAVSDQCAAVEAWAEQCDSIPELQDAAHKLAAIDEYLSRTSTEGRGRVAAAMRRLEVRIGQLLGPARMGGVNGHNKEEVTREGTHLVPNQRMEFRAMADNPEVVEEVIAESTDQAPPSRRKITRRIKDAKAAHPKAAERLAARIARATEMASAGYSSRQIATELGYSSAEGFRKFRVDHGIVVPADDLVGKSRRIDPDRVMTELVMSAINSSSGADLIDYDRLDRSRLEEWVSSLSDAISSLTTIKRNLQKELTRGQA